jgi:hypothetical protein
MADKISPKTLALTPERLRWRCDPDRFSFKTTNDIPPSMR